MTHLHHTKYRYGFTGTLDGTQTHKWVLEGLFGPCYRVTRTKELMEKGHVSDLEIRCLILKHTPKKFDTYEDEIQYLIGHERRNKFIINLAKGLEGNPLLLLLFFRIFFYLLTKLRIVVLLLFLDIYITHWVNYNLCKFRSFVFSLLPNVIQLLFMCVFSRAILLLVAL